MDFDETMVEEDFDNEGTDDTLPEEVVEEEQDESEDLSSITGEEESDEEQPDDQPKAKAERQEPGYVKRRIEKEVAKATAKAVAETEARMQAMFDKQMAPIRARMLEDEAQELVRTRKVADIETARELVRLRNGQPAAEPKAEQPRQANGQFASRTDAVHDTRIEMLNHQADRILAAKGPDVRQAFMNDEDIKMKVVSGEWDFYDVADHLKNQKPKRRPPSPMRSPNGASGTNPNAIDSMSDEQFEKMERKIKEGARYTLR